MPTFKLDEDDTVDGYLGDNDMYFRQWRPTSMKPILEKKFEKDFRTAEERKEDLLKRRAEMQKKHDEKFERKLAALQKEMENKAKIGENPTKEPFFRKATQEEKENIKKSWEREWREPSSTARMVPARQLPPKPKNVPVFGTGLGKIVNKPLNSLKSLDMGGLKNAGTLTDGSPKDNSFLNQSQESVFFPQENNSFNLDNYNGTRPSFAFSGLPGATSTPVSKTAPKFSVGSQISEEPEDESKYITAMESPIEIRKNEQPPKTGLFGAESTAKPGLFGSKPAESLKEVKTGLFGLKTNENVVLEKAAANLELKNEPKSGLFERKGLFGSKSENKGIFNTETGLFGSKPLESSKDTKIGFFGLKSDENSASGKATTSLELKNKPKTGFFEQKGLFGSKTENKGLEEKGHENVPKTGLFGSKASEPSQIGLFGSKSTEKPENSTIFGSQTASDAENRVPFGAPPKSVLSMKLAAENAENVEEVENLTPRDCFKRYVKLYHEIMRKKVEFEKIAEPKFRSLMKRTIIEKVTIFTQRETSKETRDQIFTFFRSLLNKEIVEGFAGLSETTTLQLTTDNDVFYATYCIIDKYMSLVEHDDELATTISDLITKLLVAKKKVEPIFISMIFNKSVILRQVQEECVQEFEKSNMDPDAMAIVINKEKALATLFLNVFAKTSVFVAHGRQQILGEQQLWQYTESVLEWSFYVPKSAILLTLLITVGKPVLRKNDEKWQGFLNELKENVLPELEENGFEGDYAIVGNLKQILG